MSWVIDSNLGASIFAIPTVAPFTSGTQVLNMIGGGAVYNSSYSLSDQHIFANFTNYKSNFGNGRRFCGLIGRRQASGDFYAGGVAIRSGGTPHAYQIYHYTASSNTLSTLAANAGDGSDTDVPLNSTSLFQLGFRLEGSNLTVFFNGAARIAIHNTLISTAGNPGVFSDLMAGDSLSPNLLFGNFSVRETA